MGSVSRWSRFFSANWRRAGGFSRLAKSGGRCARISGYVCECVRGGG
ncbi:hypothetical protein KC19_8G179900 [Ceratodon purpureus]|uniref:Uncharacterized protein n=1 Tax=Ceratodon purpureus TaxID=3225 RepID=A0A8T0H4F8_CERPU|nr:hypothetical protein KC19_8G179900 [Ceratodon purpureus]